MARTCTPCCRSTSPVVVLLGMAAALCGNSPARRSLAQQPVKIQAEAPDQVRGQPNLMLPVEAKVAVVHAQMGSYNFQANERTGKLQVQVLLDREKPTPRVLATRENEIKRLAAQFGRANIREIVKTFKGTDLLTRSDRGDLVERFTRSETKFIPVDALAETPSVTLLRTIRPVRMAVIAASFPFKAEVEEFRKQLRLKTERDVLNEVSLQEVEGIDPAINKKPHYKSFHFLGVVVERRLVDQEGKPLFPIEGQNGYVPLDVAAAYKPLLFLSGMQMEDEDPDHDGILMQGLVMPRLLSARENQYPNIERDLPTIKKTLDALKKERERGGKNLLLPDLCLIRVIDVTVKPGASYQYRLRVRMANPNFNRKDVANPRDAEAMELAPQKGMEWFEIPGILTMPPELHYYAVDQKVIDGDKYQGGYTKEPVHRDQTVLQIHKYLDNAAPGKGTHVPVGEWSVAERVIVSRGEVIDRAVRVQLPVLVEEEGKWRLASTPSVDDRKKREPGIDVPFNSIPLNGHLQREAILVDFDGGTLKFKREGGKEVTDRSEQEVLILSPDGKLNAHYVGVDTADMERKAKYDEWKKRIEELRKVQEWEKMKPKEPFNPFDR